MIRIQIRNNLCLLIRIQEGKKKWRPKKENPSESLTAVPTFQFPGSEIFLTLGSGMEEFGSGINIPDPHSAQLRATKVFWSGSHEEKKITLQRNNFLHLLFNFRRLDVFLLAGLAEAALAAVLEWRTEAVRPEVLLVHLVRVLLTLVRRGLLVFKILSLLQQTKYRNPGTRFRGNSKSNKQKT